MHSSNFNASTLVGEHTNMDIGENTGMDVGENTGMDVGKDTRNTISLSHLTGLLREELYMDVGEDTDMDSDLPRDTVEPSDSKSNSGISISSSGSDTYIEESEPDEHGASETGTQQTDSMPSSTNNGSVDRSTFNSTTDKSGNPTVDAGYLADVDTDASLSEAERTHKVKKAKKVQERRLRHRWLKDWLGNKSSRRVFNRCLEATRRY